MDDTAEVDTAVVPIVAWRPQVMRHVGEDGHEEYVIHEVYLGTENQIVTGTVDALSPRTPSVDALRALLTELLARNEQMALGDLNYSYGPEDIEYWLECLVEPPVDFEP